MADVLYPIVFFVILVVVIFTLKFLFSKRESYGDIMDILNSTDDNCLGRL